MDVKALTQVIEKLINTVEGSKRVTFPILSNGDRINRDNRELTEEQLRSTVTSFKEIATISRKAIKDEQKRMDSFFKGLGRGASVLDGFYHRVRKSGEDLEKSVKNQSQKFKDSAKNMEAFTRSTYKNTKKLDDTTEKLDAIDQATRSLQEKAKKKVHIEQEIQNLTSRHLKKQVELSKNTDNYSTEQERVYRARLRLEKRLVDAKGDEARELQESIANLEKARKMLIDLQKTDSFEQFRDAIKSVEEWKDSSDEHLRAIYKELQVAGDSNEDIIAGLENVVDAVGGAKVGYSIAEERNANKLIELSEKRNRILESLGPQLIAGLADTSRREISMLETRQQRMGTQSYALLPRALAMGMSESDLLTITDENRYLLRRLALASGEQGEISHLRGDFRREIHSLGKELGFIGSEAMRGMLEIADSLRIVGVDATTATLRDMTSFIKDTHVQFGLTQEEMIGAFRSMTEEGLMAIRFMHREDSVEAMQEEVEARLKLGRLLNQDIETMKKREREMAARLTGNPVEMFQRSIAAQILATQQGFTAEEARLIGMRFRADETMSPEERKRARDLEEDLRARSAQFRADQITGGTPFAAVVTDNLMGRAAIDVVDATQEQVRRMAGIDERTTRSDEPAKRLNEFAGSLLRAREVLRGVTESSFGAFTAAIFSSVGSLIHLAASATIAGLSLGRLGIMGGLSGKAGKLAAMRGPALLGAGAAAVGYAGVNAYMGRQMAHMQYDSGAITELQRDQALRDATFSGVGQAGGAVAGSVAGGKVAGMVGGRLAGAMAGTKIGAAAGTVVPGAGNIIGSIAGMALGFLAGDKLASALSGVTSSRQRQEDTRQLIRDGIYGEHSPEYAIQDRSDGTMSLYRMAMGKRSEITLRGSESEEMRKLMQESESIKQKLSHEGLSSVLSPARRQELEDELEEKYKQKEAMMRFDPVVPEELQLQRADIFSSIDRLADTKGRSPRHFKGAASSIDFNERSEAQKQMLTLFAGVDDGDLSLMFDNEQQLLAVMETIKDRTQGSESEKVKELLEKLEDVLLEIGDNTERTAEAGEKSLSELAKRMSMASDEAWRYRIDEVISGAEQMSKPRDPSAVR